MGKKKMSEHQLKKWGEARKIGKKLYVAVFWVLIMSFAQAGSIFIFNSIASLTNLFSFSLEEITFQFVFFLVVMMPVNYFLGNHSWKRTEAMYNETIALTNNI